MSDAGRRRWVSLARWVGVPDAAGPVQRTCGVLAFGVLTVAMLWPLTFAAGTDSFPFSSFPMFARARSPILESVSLHGVMSSGERVRLPPGLAAGSPEVLQARALINRAVTTSGQAMEALCDDALARSQRAWSPAPVAVQVRYERFDAPAYYRGQRAPLKERLLHCCASEPETCPETVAAQKTPAPGNALRSAGAEPSSEENRHPVSGGAP